MGAGRSGQPRVELVEAAPGAHGGERGGQAALGRRGVVDVVGGDAAEVVAGGELGEGVVARRVERIAVVPQLDEHPVAAERLDQALQLASGGGRPIGDERRRHRTLAAPGEHPHVAGGVAGDVGERELRRPLLPRQVAEAQRPRQAGVAGGPVGEQQEVVAVRVGGVTVGHQPGAHLRRGRFLGQDHRLLGGEARCQRDLGAEHGRHADGPGRLGEADDAVEAVVIGDGERFQPEPGGLGGQLLGVRGAVEEREVGVAVQLGVRDVTGAPLDALRLEGLAATAPRRPVTAGVPRRAARRTSIAPATRERGLQLAPRPRRVVEAQDHIIERRFYERKFAKRLASSPRMPAIAGSARVGASSQLNQPTSWLSSGGGVGSASPAVHR